MLLQDPKRDTTFKQELAQYVDATRIDSRRLLDRIRKENLYSRLGTAFRSLARDDFEKASAQAHRGQQVATGSDKIAFYFLTSLLDLLSFATPSGTIVFQELPPNAKVYFVWALEHARELGNQKVSLKELVIAEIETICPGAPTIIRLGQYSDNRLGDFLLQGPDDFRVFAVDHLDRLHSSGIRVYDSCYPALLDARNATHSTQLQRRITEVIKRIERDNPAATLPIIARNVISAIRAGADPLQHFRASTQLHGLPPEDLCILVLALCHGRCLAQLRLSFAEYGLFSMSWHTACGRRGGIEALMVERRCQRPIWRRQHRGAQERESVSHQGHGAGSTTSTRMGVQRRSG